MKLQVSNRRCCYVLHSVILQIIFCCYYFALRYNVNMFACPSVCLSGTDVHCDHTVHFSSYLRYDWIVQCSGHPDTKACPRTTIVFSRSTWKRGGVWMWKLGEALNANNDKQELIIEMRNPNVTWRIIWHVYLFTTELRHTCSSLLFLSK